MKDSIIKKLELEKTDIWFGVGFVVNEPVYQNKEGLYFTMLNEDGSFDPLRNLVMVFKRGVKDGLRTFSRTFISAELIDTCELSFINELIGEL